METLILIVEDNDANRQMLGWMLEDAEYEFLEAETGEKAVELATQHTNISLVLMDITLPGISGKEATKQIRQLEAHAATPVIALTAHTDPSEHEDIIASGLNEVQTKPIDEDVLLDTISKYIS